MILYPFVDVDYIELDKVAEWLFEKSKWNDIKKILKITKDLFSYKFIIFLCIYKV